MDTSTYNKLLYESSRRGMRELDFILGGFFKSYGLTFTKEEDLLYQAFLKQEDSDIIMWIMLENLAPLKFTELILKIRTHCKMH